MSFALFIVNNEAPFNYYIVRQKRFKRCVLCDSSASLFSLRFGFCVVGKRKIGTLNSP